MDYPLYLLPVIRITNEDSALPYCNFYGLSREGSRWRPLLPKEDLIFWHGLFYQKLKGDDIDGAPVRFISGTKFQYGLPGEESSESPILQLPFLLNDNLGQDFFSPTTRKVLSELREHFMDASLAENNASTLVKQCISPEILEYYRAFVVSLSSTVIATISSPNSHLKRLIRSLDDLVSSTFTLDPIVSVTSQLELLSAARQCDLEESGLRSSEDDQEEDTISLYSASSYSSTSGGLLSKLPPNVVIVSMVYPRISLQILYLDLTAFKPIPTTSSFNSNSDEEEGLDSLIPGTNMTIRDIYNQTVWEWHESSNRTVANCFAILKVPSISDDGTMDFHVQRLS